MGSYIVQLDFCAAFDRASHRGLLFKLKSVGVGGSVLSICMELRDTIYAGHGIAGMSQALYKHGHRIAGVSIALYTQGHRIAGMSLALYTQDTVLR